MLLPLKVHIYLLPEEPINEEYAYVLPEDILQQAVAKLSEQALLAIILRDLI